MGAAFDIGEFQIRWDTHQIVDSGGQIDGIDRVQRWIRRVLIAGTVDL